MELFKQRLCRQRWFSLPSVTERFGLGVTATPEPTDEGSGATAEVHDHRGDFSVDDLLAVVEVQHVNRRHLGGSAARSRTAPRVGLVNDVTVGVLLNALAGAVVGFVALGGDYPVPTEILEVDGERIPAAAGLGGMLVAVEASVAPGAFGGVRYFDLKEGLL